MRTLRAVLLTLTVACVTATAPSVGQIAREAKAVKSVTIAPDSMPLYVGDVGKAFCYPRNGTKGTGTLLANTCTWRTLDTTIAKATSGSQTSSVTARKLGKTKLIATSSGKADTIPAVVLDTTTPPALKAIGLTPASATVDSGATKQFASIDTMTNGSTRAFAGTWSATGGTITATGLYTAGSAAGGFTVIAAEGTKSDTASVAIVVPPPPPPPPPATAWAGVNANTGFYTDPAYVAAVNATVTDLGLSGVRMGMDGVGGSSDGAAFSWSARDATVASHIAASLGIRAVVSFRSQVSHGASTADWQQNWAYFVGGVFRHYAGQVDYYIIDNEPELNGITDASLAVAMTKIAWDTAQAIGGIQIESPPTGSAASSFLHQMIDAGVTRYCDFLGTHGYGGQINDAHSQSIKTPWGWMQTANATSGYPIRPLSNSENGFDASYGGRDWQARSFQLSYVQHKRYGYDHILLYSLRSTAGSNFDIASWNGSALVANQPTYDAVTAGFVGRALTNAGFESANNVNTEWVIYWNTAQIGTPVEWSRAAFVTGDPVNAHSGSGYLRFDTGESTAGNIVRRVVEGLMPGQPYTLSAWVKLTGGGTATLKAQGYNSLNGMQEAAQATSTTGTWQQITVSFAPTKSWVVIDLEGTGTGVAGQVMRWDDVSLSP